LEGTVVQTVVAVVRPAGAAEMEGTEGAVGWVAQSRS
jgi:hypothetical protein